MPIHDGVSRHAAERPLATALVADGQTVSFRQLQLAAEAVAAGLADERAGPDLPAVGILGRPSAEFLEIFLGASIAGWPAMVLETGWSSREMAEVLQLDPPDVLFVDEALMKGVPHGVAGRIVVIGEPDGNSAAIGYREWRTRRRPEPAPVAHDDSIPFYIGFTSGTTGRPKGLVRDHASWLASFQASDVEFGINARDQVLVPGPLDHSHFLYGAVQGLSRGATVHIFPKFDADIVLATVAEQPITRLYVVPTMTEALVRWYEHRRLPAPYADVEMVLSAGSRWEPALKDKASKLFPNADLVDYFGASETSFISAASWRRGDPPDSVGRPVAGVEVQVRHPDGTVAAPGEMGRLFVRSKMLFLRYLRPEDGDVIRDDHGWISLTDLARLDDRGFLHVIGREGNMLISGGLNIFPEEVEDVLRDLPEVAEVAVVGLPNEYWGDLVAGVVQWRGGQRLSREALRTYCRAKLSVYKCPRVFYTVGEFPRTASGKIARARLRQAITDAEPERIL